MAALDLSKFTFSVEEIRDINELVFDNILHAPDLNFLHTLIPNVKYAREMGFIGDSGLIGKKGQGCNPTTQDWKISTRKVVIDPKSWEVDLKECAADLENTAVRYAFKNHTAMDDLTGTDYMAIYVEVLTNAIKDMIFRFVWFNDTEAANYTSGGSGIITAGVDVDYFNVIDGLFKQLEAAATNNGLLVPIAANSEATSAAQLSAMTGDVAVGILEALYYKAPIEMRSGNMQFLVTQTVADGYQKYLSNLKLESTYHNLVDGIKALKYNGIDVIPIPMWDKMIQSYNVVGDKFYKPHRALLVEKENLAVAFPSEEAFGSVEIWYNIDTKETKSRLKDRIDAKLLDDKRFVFAE